MSDNVNDIAAYYNSDPLREHSRLERHQLEHELTWKYLNKFLPAQGNILEIGAATGKYTLDLAKRGYSVTAVDMSAGLLEENRRSIAKAGLEKQVQFVEADARDLSQITSHDFDAILLMGPLYHLIELEDRQTVLRQAIERLRRDGIIFSAFISRFGIMGDLLKNVPEWIKDREEISQDNSNDEKQNPHYDFVGCNAICFLLPGSDNPFFSNSSHTNYYRRSNFYNPHYANPSLALHAKRIID